ncbi:MAG TPA: hypothetical protein VL202_08460 [Pararhizobium sp.]|uniref:hypothetical protein n=1 Tax=Pararhizobium sp. TaxID=1977563 RepID=UPI002B803785|nr:hypothetical protein [Pararhizobium sp.]HTO31193.1 hypothetical protein [Pararhizobium sp.]
MVEEITPAGFRDRLIAFVGGVIDRLPTAVIDRLNNPEQELASLLNDMVEGDQLWWCRSEKRAVLIGNEGVAVVRDGRAIAYILVWHH